MTNYKEMYLKMARASEQAANILIAAQQACEELYISEPEIALTANALPGEKENT